MKPDISAPLRNILARIGKPPSVPFVPDEFQVKGACRYQTKMIAW